MCLQWHCEAVVYIQHSEGIDQKLRFWICSSNEKNVCGPFEKINWHSRGKVCDVVHKSSSQMSSLLGA